MMQIPQPENTPDAREQCPESEESAQIFKPVLSEPFPKNPSRKPLIILGVAAVVIVVGLIFCGGEPDTAKAKPAPLDVSKMTAPELAQNASPPAASELARRMVDGTAAEQSAASAAITTSTSPRLARNLAMAMAVQQQKKNMEMMRRVHQNEQMLMGETYRANTAGR